MAGVQSNLGPVAMPPLGPTALPPLGPSAVPPLPSRRPPGQQQPRQLNHPPVQQYQQQQLPYRPGHFDHDGDCENYFPKTEAQVPTEKGVMSTPTLSTLSKVPNE